MTTPETPEKETPELKMPEIVSIVRGPPSETSSEDERSTYNDFSRATETDWKPKIVREQDFDNMPVRFVNVGHWITRPALSTNREMFKTIFQLAKNYREMATVSERGADSQTDLDPADAELQRLREKLRNLPAASAEAREIEQRFVHVG